MRKSIESLDGGGWGWGFAWGSSLSEDVLTHMSLPSPPITGLPHRLPEAKSSGSSSPLLTPSRFPRFTSVLCAVRQDILCENKEFSRSCADPPQSLFFVGKAENLRRWWEIKAAYDACVGRKKSTVVVGFGSFYVKLWWVMISGVDSPPEGNRQQSCQAWGGGVGGVQRNPASLWETVSMSLKMKRMHLKQAAVWLKASARGQTPRWGPAPLWIMYWMDTGTDFGGYPCVSVTIDPSNSQ